METRTQLTFRPATIQGVEVYEVLRGRRPIGFIAQQPGTMDWFTNLDTTRPHRHPVLAAQTLCDDVDKQIEAERILDLDYAGAGR